LNDGDNIEKLTGIVLYGGTGSRLYPLTASINKHLLPVYSKPMLNYALSTLLLMGVQDIVIVCNPKDLATFESFFSFTLKSKLKIKFAIQQNPNGVTDGISCALPFIESPQVLVVLGDNIFFGTRIINEISHGINPNHECTIFSYFANSPERFGVVQRDVNGDVLQIIEKPSEFISNEVVTGLYYFNVRALAQKLKNVTPSARGELEITSILNAFLYDRKIDVKHLSRGNYWIDAGTIDDLLGASEFVKSYEIRSGRLIACPEEIIFKNGWITDKQLKKNVTNYPDGPYRNYVQKMLTPF